MQLHADKNDFLRYEGSPGEANPSSSRKHHPNNAASTGGTMNVDSHPRSQQISAKHAKGSGRSASWSSLYSQSEDANHLQDKTIDLRTRTKSPRSYASDSTASEPHRRPGVRVM